MTTRLIAGPQALAVDLDAAKAALKIDGTDQDALITAYIEGITAHAEHYTGRAFITQTWQVTLDRFPTDGRGGDGAIYLYNAPLAAVSHVKYYDEGNVQQTLDPQDYNVDDVSEPGCIVPAPDAAWPSTYSKVNAVEVQYTCGYGASHADVPKAIKLYIIAKLIEQFDPATSGAALTVGKPYTVSYIESLLDRHKIWSL
jgi:uncharacterized phiE125 gp8 family phage protein